MPRDSTATRTAIMDAAERLILESGYSATTIDNVIAGAGITKGTFFYHFDNKAALAQALVDRYAARDHALLDEHMARAERLSRDPLQQLLIFIGLFQEEAEALTEPYPGCLFASFCYEAGLFSETTLEVSCSAMLAWRDRLAAKLAAIVEAGYKPQMEVDMERLAEMLTVVFEGAFIVSKTMRDPKTVAAQAALYRTYIELLFKA